MGTQHRVQEPSLLAKNSQVTDAVHGAEALAKLEAQTFDIVPVQHRANLLIYLPDCFRGAASRVFSPT